MDLNSIGTQNVSIDARCINARNNINAIRATGVDFTSLMRTKVNDLTFSAHAKSRMKSREIVMTDDMMTKLENAVNGAHKKGARDILVLLKELAFIVNIPNRTVVTAMDGDNIRDNVFTNIDSTVIV